MARQFHFDATLSRFHPKAIKVAQGSQIDPVAHHHGRGENAVGQFAGGEQFELPAGLDHIALGIPVDEIDAVPREDR